MLFLCSFKISVPLYHSGLFYSKLRRIISLHCSVVEFSLRVDTISRSRCFSAWHLNHAVASPTTQGLHMIKSLWRAARPQDWSLGTGLFSVLSQKRMRWDAVGRLHWYSILRLAAQDVPYSPPLLVGMPGQTCSCLADLHLCGHPWRSTSSPPTNSPCLPWAVTRPCVLTVCFIFSLDHASAFFSSLPFFPPGISFLKWKQSWGLWSLETVTGGLGWNAIKWGVEGWTLIYFPSLLLSSSTMTSLNVMVEEDRRKKWKTK